MIASERKGRLKSWNDDKGFGFITPDSGGADVFTHISVVRGDRRPLPGDEVLYVEGRDQSGRVRAEHMRLAGGLRVDQQAIRRKPAGAGKTPAKPPVPRKGTSRPASGAAIHNAGGKLLILIALCLLPLLAALQGLRDGWWWLLPLYLLASLVSFVQYCQDKNSAERGRWRTPEKILHLTELLGGWPGALVAQQVFRHKTRKASYQVLFWLIVAAHQLLCLDLLLFGGGYLLRHLLALLQ